ncbi:hypothetical protein ACFWVP_05480 [Streptomyces sp. NPDC058637]|uniref:hypothetical protein n=1 Tax=Streptomyces sp. NPDC058637 TaxID=3346569 RepID=UPI003660D079
MNTLPEPYANRQVEAVEVDASGVETVEAKAVEVGALLIEARRELGLREAETRVARHEVRRLRRARRAEMYHRVVRNTQVPFRVGCAVLGALAFLASAVMFAQGHQQAADTLSAAGAFWALAVMLRPSR